MSKRTAHRLGQGLGAEGPRERAAPSFEAAAVSPVPAIPPTHVTSLTSLSEAMGGEKSPKEILQLILKSAFSITRATSASLMLLAAETDVLRVEVAEGFKNRSIFRTRLRVGQGVTGWVAETGVPLRVGNVTKDPRYVRVQRGLRSELAVPLKVAGRVLGVISVDSARLNHFSAEDEALLISLAALSARVIQTARLYEETRRRAAELGLLMEAGRVLAGSLDLHKVLDKLVELTARFWRAPIASVYLVSEDGKSLALASAHGGTEAYRRQPPLPILDSLLGRVLKNKNEAAVIHDLDKRLAGAPHPLVRPKEAHGLMAAPLAAKDRALGVLCVFGRRGHRFGMNEQRLLAGLASSAALAIENAHIYRKMLAAEASLRREEKSTLLVELASALAHEIRNPLTSIKILTEALVRSQALPVESRPDAQMIQKQVERLEQIVGGYLESARSHASRMEHKVLDLNGVVDESLLLLATTAGEGTRINCALSPEELRVTGDPTQLSQAVYNLVLNALQAVAQPKKPSGPSGRGRIEIKSGRLEGDAGVFAEVADDGPGLSEEIRQHLFQPFVTSKEQGVGLGLSIVKRIVEAHGGRLEVESPRAGLDRGARFRIVLPEAR